MALTGQQFTVTSGSALLLATGVGETRVIIHTTTNIAVGPTNGVTSSTGFVIPGAQTDVSRFEFVIQNGDEVWGIAQSSTSTVSVMTTS